jgi:hypothetical protein
VLGVVRVQSGDFAPFTVSVLILLGGGAAKLAHPADTIARLGIPRAGATVRLRRSSAPLSR